MRSARRYTPTNSRFFTTLVRWTYGIWLRLAYNIQVVGLDRVRNLHPPFVLVGNHTNILDPFILNAIIPHPIHWVTSDGNMRKPLIRFLLLKLVGSSLPLGYPPALSAARAPGSPDYGWRRKERSLDLDQG